jgi:(R)-2-hydroxyacyl-CoA dehydratese activating ATPase
MICMGCDVGSLFTKVVILDGDDPVATKIARTTGNISRDLPGLLEDTAKEAGMDRKKIECLGATGKGAEFVPGADFTEGGMNCVAAAVAFYAPDADMVIEIGGQSITSMLIDEDGEIKNFMRNDKCASGSGRFLEVMSAKLGVDLTDIDKVAKSAKSPVEISNQCGVFAESEVITHVNAGEALPDIISGVCSSVSNIVAAQARRFGVSGNYALTGGVARFEAISDEIKGKLDGTFVKFPFDPKLAAAFGAALLGDAE